MKVVVAIIQPFKLNEVRDALAWAGIAGMTVTEVRSFGREHGHTEIYRGAEYAMSFVPRVKIEVVVSAPLVNKVVDAIMETASPGEIGDGKIFVANIEQIMRIRTRETDVAAL